ncbi:MAG: CarD family transcriptional regulator [Holosporales bacterium]
MTLDLKDGDLVVYPSHGVGRLTDIENQQVAGFEIQVFVINFDKSRMTLRLPMAKAKASGLRHLSSCEEVNKALESLKSRLKPKKGLIWSRRAQEYETKINSGSLHIIAEVLRELHRSGAEEQSFSERQIYQTALERFASEIAAIENLSEAEVIERVENLLKAA